MQIGLEGLPRSGKSYTAVKEHIIPAIKAGRRVVSNIEGLNWAYISEITGHSPDRDDLLISIKNDQVQNLHEIIKFGDLVCIDECHEFWPISRQPLPEKAVKFFAMHGHDQIDIVLMTQLFTEVHRSVVARLERKNTYTKKSVVGKPNECHVNYYQKAAGSMKWIKINSASFAYDKNIFPCYKGFSDNPAGKEGGEGYQVYGSDEAVFWTKKMKFMTAAVVLGLCFAIYKFTSFFTDNPIAEAANEKQKTQAVTQQNSQAKPAANPASTDTAVVSQTTGFVAGRDQQRFVQPDENYIENLSKKYRIRLTGYIMSAGKPITGAVEWRTEKETVIERLTFLDLKDFGFTVGVSNNILYLHKGKEKMMATMWPLEERNSVQRIQSGVPQGSPVRASELPTPAVGSMSSASNIEALQMANYGQFRQ